MLLYFKELTQRYGEIDTLWRKKIIRLMDWRDEALVADNKQNLKRGRETVFPIAFEEIWPED